MAKKISIYLLLFTLNAAIFNAAMYFVVKRYYKVPVPIPEANGKLINKLEYYKKNSEKFNLLFVGDSRTYTNFHNAAIDSALGLKSYNLSMWANWFPTQYSFLQDLLPLVPDSTTIIFSIGHQNFNYGEIQETYPITAEKARDYISWGFEKKELGKPMKLADINIKPLLFESRVNLNKWLMSLLESYFAVIFCKNKQTTMNEKAAFGQSTLSLSESKKNAAAEKYLTALSGHPDVDYILKKYQGDTLTSLEVTWKHGNYWRIELDSLFFRNKQVGDLVFRRLNDTSATFKPDQRYIHNFEAIISLLKAHSRRLKIFINEVGEAPYMYYQPGFRASCDSFMNNYAKKYVETNGMKYIKVNSSDLNNYHYFDYNHLNHKGAHIYTNRFINLFRKTINAIQQP